MAVYLYGLVSSGIVLPDLPEGIVPEASAYVISEDGASAVCCAVSEEEFSGEALQLRLSDVSWLDKKVRAHESVVEAVLEVSPILPMRFCTVYRDEDGVRQMLRRHGGAFAQALSFLKDKVEVGLKIYFDRKIMRHKVSQEDAQIRRMAEDIERRPAGTAYLLKKRYEQQMERRVEEEQAALVDTVQAGLQAYVIERFGHDSTYDPREDNALVMNASYLIENSRFGDMVGSVQEMNERYCFSGLRCAISGPWPPYCLAGQLELDLSKTQADPALSR